MAETVERKKPRLGPVPEVGYVDTGGGEVRYSTEGWGLIVAGRRRSALRRMRRVCKKLAPKIVDEFTRDDVDVPYSQDELENNLAFGHDHYQVHPYHHIMFECLPPADQEPLEALAAKSGAPSLPVAISSEAAVAPPSEPAVPISTNTTVPGEPAP